MSYEDDARARWENRAGSLGCSNCKTVWTEERRKVENFWGLACDNCGLVLCEKCRKSLRSLECPCGCLLLFVPNPLLKRDLGPQFACDPGPLSRLADAFGPSLRFFFRVALVCLSLWIFTITMNSGETALAPIPPGTFIVGGFGGTKCEFFRNQNARLSGEGIADYWKRTI